MPAAPPWAQTPPPAAATPPWAQTPPPAAATPPWLQTPPQPPSPTAQPPYGAAPYSAPPSPAQPPYGAPFGAAPYGAPVAVSTGSTVNPLGGLMALLGGVVAIGSAWLPWSMASADPMQTAAWGKPIEISNGLANGNYLIGAGALAAACGLLLLLGVARTPGARTVLGLGAIAGAIAVGVVEFSAYGQVSDALKSFGPYTGLAYGFGLFVGAGGAGVAGLGGLVALVSKPAAAGSKPSSTQGLVRVIAIVLIAAVALGAGGYLLSQNNKPTGPAASGSLGPSGASNSPGNAPTGTPGSSPSFLTSGYPTIEEAIGAYVAQHAVSYAGDCNSPGVGDYCSALDSAISDTQSVYTVGPVASDAVAWLLLQQTSDGLWHVLDQKPFTSGSTSPW